MKKMKKITEITAIVNACKKIAELRLVKCSSGNLSCRCENGNAALSATGAWLEKINEKQIATCNINSGKTIGDITPTVEAGMHLGILKNRKDVNVVLHFQSPFATAMACRKKIKQNFNCIIEVPAYIGTPAVVDFHMPGSKKLAEAVTKAMEKHNMAILKNHGLVTVGKNFDETIQRAVFFELACKIITIQKNCQFLTNDAVEKLKHLSKA